jgi:hypothetical protein
MFFLTTTTHYEYTQSHIATHSVLNSSIKFAPNAIAFFASIVFYLKHVYEINQQRYGCNRLNFSQIIFRTKQHSIDLSVTCPWPRYAGQ